MKELEKKFNLLVGRHRRFTVFDDLCTLLAITIRNQVDRGNNWQQREDKYLKTIKKYNEKEIDIITNIFALITIELEKNPRDVLGELYMRTDTGSKELGQFFTPGHIADLSSGILHDAEMIKSQIGKHGYIELMEPAVGSGVFIVSYVKKMIEEGLNPQRQLYVQATDIDLTAVHMAYIQLSLLGIPARIIHGDTISLRTWDIWHTPFYYLNYPKMVSTRNRDRT